MKPTQQCLLFETDPAAQGFGLQAMLETIKPTKSRK